MLCISSATNFMWNFTTYYLCLNCFVCQTIYTRTRCKHTRTHTFWPHPQYKPKSVRFRQNNINKHTVTDKWNGMTKCPKSTLSARLVARSFFLHLSAGVFHTYIKTRCCCIVGQCIPCLLPFLIYFRLVQFTGNIFVFRSKLIGWSTNTREFFFLLPKLKIQSTNRNLYAFLGQLSSTACFLVSFGFAYSFSLCVVVCMFQQ